MKNRTQSAFEFEQKYTQKLFMHTAQHTHTAHAKGNIELAPLLITSSYNESLIGLL